jgi:hypothetical protein
LADVNTYLAQILSATYGEEVRSAIHDSINAMNIESSNAMQYAETAQDSAAASAASAQTSATSAADSATTALTAKNDAQSAQTAAANSATAAQTSATSASNSATSASNSATAAQTSATSATNSKNSAETSATSATSSATSASNSATAAQTSATSAANSANNALQAAQNAEDAETSVDAKVAEVMTMKSNLILNHAIYQELFDSNLNYLLDSTGGSILGEVIFSDVEDVTRLHKRIDDLETIINQLASLLIPNRLVIVETSMTEANESITRINEHALFDSTFI